MLPSEPTSDSVLVRECLSSNKQAYDVLVERYYGRVLSYCARRISDPIYAKDLAQEVFTCAYTNLRSLSDPAKFHSWLLGIAANMSKRFFRANRQRMGTVSYEVIADAVAEEGCGATAANAVEDEVLSRPEFSSVLRIVQGLPAKSRESIELRCIEGMSYESMAEQLNVSVNVAQQRVHYGKERLRRDLMDPFTPEEIRERISRIVTSLCNDHAGLRDVLLVDALRNQYILSLMDPIRMKPTSTRVYTYRERDLADDLMLVAEQPVGPTRAIIKSENADATKALVHRLPIDRRVRLCLTSPEMLGVVERYCEVQFQKPYPTYCLMPEWLNTSMCSDLVTKVPVPSADGRLGLLNGDSQFWALLKTAENRDSQYRDRYELFALAEHPAENTTAYALFVRSGAGNLYELAHHSPIDPTGDTQLRACIASACYDLLNRGFCVTDHILHPDDAPYQESLRRVGFRHVTSNLVATVTRWSKAGGGSYL